MIDRSRGARVGVAGTPIPRRDLTVNGPSEVREYTLSPEELAEIQAKYPLTERDKKFKKPVEIKPKPNKEEEVMPRGRKPKVTEGASQLLREKETTVQAPVNLDLLDKAEREIERLTAEVEQWKGNTEKALKTYDEDKAGLLKKLKTVRGERDSHAAIMERMKRDLASSGEELSSLRVNLEDLTSEIGRLTSEVDVWMDRASAAADQRDAAEHELSEALEELDCLRAKLHAVPAQGLELTAPEPLSEAHILDTAIADLTRARWIIGRLSAAGE